MSVKPFWEAKALDAGLGPQLHDEIRLQIVGAELKAQALVPLRCRCRCMRLRRVRCRPTRSPRGLRL